MARYVSSCDKIDHTPSSAVAVGQMVAIGTGMTGIADRPIPANTLGALCVEGVFAVDKATTNGTALTAGTKVYLNTSTGKVTSSANSGGQSPTTYPPVGIVVKDAADADAEVMVLLTAW